MVLPVPCSQPSRRSRSAAPSDGLASTMPRARCSASSPPSCWNVLRADSNALAASLPSFPDDVARQLVEVRLAAVEMVEAPRHFARELDVRRLVLAHRHVRGLVDEDVGGLQERVAEEAVGREIAVLQLLHLVLVGRHALEPAERRAHRQQREQLGVLGQAALDEDGRVVGVDAGGEPVDHHVVDVLLDDAALFVVRRERVPVGDEVEAVVVLLQPHPVLQRAVVVAEMERAGGPHAGQHALAARRGGTGLVARRGDALAHRWQFVVGKAGDCSFAPLARRYTLARA